MQYRDSQRVLCAHSGQRAWKYLFSVLLSRCRSRALHPASKFAEQSSRVRKSALITVARTGGRPASAKRSCFLKKRRPLSAITCALYEMAARRLEA